MKASQYFKDWLTSLELVLQRSTYEANQIYFTRHIIPYFEALNIDLKDITPLIVQQYAKQKLKGGRLDGKSGGLSLVSVRKHISVMKQALKDAVLYGYISTNPAAYVKLPKKQGTLTERTVLLTAQEAQEVISAFEGHNLYLPVILALYYGLRRSEVLGLKWSAIDFERNTLTIRHTVVKNLTIEAKDSTKTSTSRRTFQLLPEVGALLREARERKPPQSEYICVWEDGRLMRPDYVTKAFQKVLQAHGLPKMRFHDLRHSTASILFDKGWALEDVKNWLGHADIETTSNIYLHYGSARKIMLAGSLAGMFKI